VLSFDEGQCRGVVEPIYSWIDWSERSRCCLRGRDVKDVDLGKRGEFVFQANYKINTSIRLGLIAFPSQYTTDHVRRFDESITTVPREAESKI